jgi:hypothetical protein
METANGIELTDGAVYPDEKVLKSVLGRSYRTYCALIELFDRNEMHCEWRYYTDGKAWLCKVQKKKRTIVWMSAWKGFMQATMYIPAKFEEAIYALPISEESRQYLRASRNVGKSKPCTFEIRNQKVLKDFNTVMQFKIQAK